jgi:anti-anti-sigma factor
MALNASYSDQDRTVTVRITGRFDFGVHREFRETYKERNDVAQYLVDLNGTEYMDSSALGMLLLLREHASGNGATVRIVNCNPEIRQILSISNFFRLFEIA